MRRSGFTLLETVIVIVFFALCVWGGRAGYRWYVRSSRADEAKAMVEKIAQAERRYFEIHGRFLALAASEDAAYPASIPEEGAAWGEGPALFRELGVAAPEGPFFFRVAVLAGAFDAPPPEIAAGYSGNRPWFYIVAFADQDGDGEESRLSLSSWGAAEVTEIERTE